MSQADQAMRWKMQEDQKAWDPVIDRKNTERLKELLKENNWPMISVYEKDVCLAAWLLVQHADHDTAFQKEILGKLQALPKGEVELQNIAYLEDRVLVNSGHLQKYGSQLGPGPNGVAIPRPIDDEAHVDERRAAMGMMTLAKYIEFANSVFKGEKK